MGNNGGNKIKLWNMLIQDFRERNLTLALAESMTCGLAAHQLSKVAGTTDVLRGSIVCYMPEMKTELSNIPKTFLEKHTPESQAVTDELAKRLKKLITADVYAAITGLAAPGGSETKQKPVGTVFFSIEYQNKISRHKKVFNGPPRAVKNKACDELYRFLLKTIKKEK